MRKKVIIAGVIIFCFIMFIFIGMIGIIMYSMGGHSSRDISFSDNKIAVIEISGVIMDSEKINDLIKKAREGDEYKAIVLRINSPGGAVGASQEIYQEVTTARAAGKIIVTSFADVGGSGAYYIACGSNRIIANPGTLTGSIGVLMSFFNWQGLVTDKLGLKFYVIKSGKYKDTGSPDRPLTDEERAYLQTVIDNVYSQFLKAVIVGRTEPVTEVLARRKIQYPWESDILSKTTSKPLEEARKSITYADISTHIKQYAEGNIYSGEQAYYNGLVDGLGNLNTAIATAGKLAHIKGEPKAVYLKPVDEGIFRKVFGEASQAINPIRGSQINLQYLMK